MQWRDEWKKLAVILASFLLLFYIPIESERLQNALIGALYLAKWYAREHVLLCLIPAFFIAGAVTVFISQASVMKYLGTKAHKVLAYTVASMSGVILAVCSCTILPLFAGIYRRGAGLGPATAFLYSGPAINILAIVLTARILGMEIGIARAIGAILFSVIIGITMHLLFKKSEERKAHAQMILPEETTVRPLWQNALFFMSLIGILLFANWGATSETDGLWALIYTSKWIITSCFALLLGVMLIFWFNIAWWKITFVALPVVGCSILIPEQPLIAFSAGTIGISAITSTDQKEAGDWFLASWEFAKQILPLLLFGILIAGALFGSINNAGLIPSEWVESAVGGNSLRSNFFASFAGAFMYFATLTEIPILQGLMNNGMGKGPALALLLAGPALSLPSILVIANVMGAKKTAVFVSLVVIMATISGMFFGSFF